MADADAIAEIKERLDIAEVIGQHVRLQKAGKSYKGLCPFHGEKTPSFHVHPDRGFYYCFGCQESGDVLTFLMKIEGLSFPEALRDLAARAGVKLPERTGRGHRKQDVREKFFEIMNFAKVFYEQQLIEASTSNVARHAIAERGISQEIITRFALGYAPLAWDALATAMRKAGVDLDRAETLGLIASRKNGPGYYDRFRHRLMFPVRDSHGRVIAFSGRQLPSEPEFERMVGQGKYINSPETPIYTKGRELFGIYEAKKELRKSKAGILCEGNFDVLSFHQAGLPVAVAPLGTALTAEQSKLLSRYVEEVTIAFDGDAAGVKAAEKSFPLLSEAHVQTSIVSFPEGYDPDTFRRKQGDDALKSLCERSIDLGEHIIDEAAFASSGAPLERSKSIAGLAPLLASVQDKIARELYLQRIAQKFGLRDMAAIRSILNQAYREQKSPPQSAPLRNKSNQPKIVQEEPSSHEQPTPVDREGPKPTPPNKITLDTLGTIVDFPELSGSDDGILLRGLLENQNLLNLLDSLGQSTTTTSQVDSVALLESAIESKPLRHWLRKRLVNPKTNLRAAKALLRSGVARIWAKRIEEEELPEIKRKYLQSQRRGEQQQAASWMEEIRTKTQHAANLKREAKRAATVASADEEIDGVIPQS